MKNNTGISTKLSQLLLIAFLSSAMWSCMDNQKTKDTKEVAEDKNDAKFDNTSKERDAQFLVNAAEINLEEIKLGQLAQQKSSTSHVKELGKMMEDDHKKGLETVIALAKLKNLSVPTTATQNAMDAYEKLNSKSGKDFDKAYSDMMVNGHKDAISLFEKRADETKDADIKGLATATLPILQMHLEHAVTCQKECEKM